MNEFEHRMIMDGEVFIKGNGEIIDPKRISNGLSDESEQLEFRFWDNIKKCYAPDGDFFINHGWSTFKNHKYIGYKESDIIPEQYVGKKDKYGKKIYKGDKFKSICTEYEIIYENGAFGYMASNNFITLKHLIDRFIHIEITGTIHEELKS